MFWSLKKKKTLSEAHTVYRQVKKTDKYLEDIMSATISINSFQNIMDVQEIL